MDRAFSALQLPYPTKAGADSITNSAQPAPTSGAGSRLETLCIKPILKKDLS